MSGISITYRYDWAYLAVMGCVTLACIAAARSRANGLENKSYDGTNPDTIEARAAANNRTVVEQAAVDKKNRRRAM
jgi:hypothetical protein